MERPFLGQKVPCDLLLTTDPISCMPPPSFLFSVPTVLSFLWSLNTHPFPSYSLYIWHSFFLGYLSLHLQWDNSPHWSLLFRCHLFRDFPYILYGLSILYYTFYFSQNLSAYKTIYLLISLLKFLPSRRQKFNLFLFTVISSAPSMVCYV